jgi:uncharacterized membrane protein YfcA
LILILLFLEILIASIVAGFFGAIAGLGGSIVIIPVLTLLFGYPIVYATGAGLVATIATSSSSASYYVKNKISNIKIGMSLEIATTAGAIIGALISAFLYASHLTYLIFITFGIVLILTIIPNLSRLSLEKFERVAAKPDWSTEFFQLRGEYFDPQLNSNITYMGVRWWLGEAIMFVAGVLSGLLGIGSGVLKVLGMDGAMKLPIKVTTTTSNFMIGVTAATGSAIYWSLGYIQPFAAASTAIGVVIGSYFGSKLLPNMHGNSIRIIFLVILGFGGIEMILRGFGVA